MEATFSLVHHTLLGTSPRTLPRLMLPPHGLCVGLQQCQEVCIMFLSEELIVLFIKEASRRTNSFPLLLPPGKRHRHLHHLHHQNTVPPPILHPQTHLHSHQEVTAFIPWKHGKVCSRSFFQPWLNQLHLSFAVASNVLGFF